MLPMKRLLSRHNASRCDLPLPGPRPDGHRLGDDGFQQDLRHFCQGLVGANRPHAASARTCSGRATRRGSHSSSSWTAFRRAQCAWTWCNRHARRAGGHLETNRLQDRRHWADHRGRRLSAEGGFVTVKPRIGDQFGGYALVFDLGERGRAFGAACVRVPKAEPGRERLPTYALDLPWPHDARRLSIRFSSVSASRGTRRRRLQQHRRGAH